ncbi:T6SS effector amidase Tae4 family protein, partial [Salmonella enterica subsp. enterica serovar Virginia]|nr:T6SS effector amidase Tae4 family protein [Salmonella enterica subsp. enterica serovar Virginia]
PKQSDFIGKKGIIVVKGHGWSNARGHVTLWNGSICSDQCHLLREKWRILLMFGVGLHFSLKDLMAVKSIAIPGAVAQIAVATLLGMALS